MHTFKSRTRSKHSNTRKNTKGGNVKVSQKSFDAILKCMLETLASIKLYHWNTFSYATHKATDDVHGSLSDNMDKYAEIFLGKSGGKFRINMRDFKTLNVSSVGSNKDMTHKCKKLISDLNRFHQGLKGDEYSDINNVRDEIVGDLNKFIYLLTLK